MRNVNDMGNLVGEIIVIILAFSNRKIAAKLISESSDSILLENRFGWRSVIAKDQILLVRKPYPLKNNPDGGDDLMRKSQAIEMHKKLGHNVSAPSALTFVKDTAEKTGVSARKNDGGFKGNQYTKVVKGSEPLTSSGFVKDTSIRS
jgi:hypothetical protein